MENDFKINKRIIHSGSEYRLLTPGARVLFHFQTRLCDDEKTLLDDSRTLGKPMELVLGKKFKLEVWETIVQAMAVNEIAQFTVDKSLVLAYPFVSKTLRDAADPEKQHKKNSHCCGSTLQTGGIGYSDLNQLLKQPCDLEFTIELLKAEERGEYQQEAWLLTEEERLSAVPLLRAEGNDLYNRSQHDAAAAKYAEAIGYLEQLMLKEKPNDVEWNELNSLKLPLLLNYAQCKLHAGDFYSVIEHCGSVLSSDPENVKALFRRAKAHAGAWNIAEAQADFEHAAALAPSLAQTINKELRLLTEAVKEKDRLDKSKLCGKMF